MGDGQWEWTDSTVKKAQERFSQLLSLCPTSDSCVQTAQTVKERIEVRLCMDPIDSERLYSSRSSSAGTPRSVRSYGTPRSKAGGLSGHVFGLPNIDMDYVKDSAPLEDVGFGDRLERYIHIKTRMRRAVLTVPKSGIPNEILPGDIEKQLQTLCRLDHPNIVPFREVCEDQTTLKLVYDWVDGGPLLRNLESSMETLRESHLAEFLRQLLSALAAANSFGIHHLDLCLSTVFVITAGTFCPIKVFGLGLAGYVLPLVSRREISKSNKHYYCSPEVFYTHNIKRLPPAARHASDVWSVGAILFTICSGRPPFGAGSVKELSKRVQRAIWSFGVEFAECSFILKDCIEEMLKVPWRSRFSAASCLRHTFVEQSVAGQQDSKLSMLALQQLEAFLDQDHCKQTVARILADTGLNQKAYAQLEKMFKGLDKNGDGSISAAELEEAAEMHGLSAIQRADVFRVLDRNGNGQLDISEFIAAVVLEHPTDEKLIGTVFSNIDRNTDSRLTKKEVFTLLRTYSGSLEVKDVSRFVKKLDADFDEKVDLAEFTGLFPSVARAEEDLATRLGNFADSLRAGAQQLSSFQESAEAWLKKLEHLEDQLLCACGYKDPENVRSAYSYEKGHLTEYDVHQMVEALVELIQEPPGKLTSKAGHHHHHHHHKKKADLEGSGPKLLGLAILASACAAGLESSSKGKAEASAASEGDEALSNQRSDGAKRDPSPLEEFNKAVKAHLLAKGQQQSEQCMLGENLYLLIKVKSECSWQPVVQDALKEMRSSAKNRYEEVSLMTRQDMTKCMSGMTDEYALREAIQLPRTRESTLVRVPEGAQLLPAQSMRGQDLTSPSALRALQDMVLPIKLVFAWKKEAAREDHQKEVHLRRLAWAGRLARSIFNDVQALLHEVEEDQDAFTTAEGDLPGRPRTSLAYLKYSQGRGQDDDALTPREDEIDLEDSHAAVGTRSIDSQELQSRESNLGELEAAMSREWAAVGRQKRIERNRILAEQVKRLRLAEQAADR